MNNFNKIAMNTTKLHYFSLLVERFVFKSWKVNNNASIHSDRETTFSCGKSFLGELFRKCSFNLNCKSIFKFKFQSAPVKRVRTTGCADRIQTTLTSCNLETGWDIGKLTNCLKFLFFLYFPSNVFVDQCAGCTRLCLGLSKTMFF